MQCNARYCEGVSVRLSLCAYVKRVDRDKAKETCARILAPHEKNVYRSFPTRKTVGGVGDDPFYLKFWAKLTLFEQKRRLSIDIRS